jgi:hypothetical protein
MKADRDPVPRDNVHGRGDDHVTPAQEPRCPQDRHSSQHGEKGHDGEQQQANLFPCRLVLNWFARL